MSALPKCCVTLASRIGQKRRNESGLKPNKQNVAPMLDGCVCNVCGKSLKALPRFKNHVCIRQSKDKQMVMEREKSYCCHHCGKLFSSLSGFKVHENKHAMLTGHEVCDLCCRHFLDEVSLNRHKQLKHWKPNMWKCHCLMCGFSTTNLQYLKRHLKSHLGTKPYGCQKCDKWFEWKGYLKAHVKAVHENTRPYPCEICGKQFKQKTSLSVHNKSEHTGEKPYSCSKCPKAFVRASSLRDHMNCHLSVKRPRKQYCCHLCNDRPFLDKTCLAVHMASAHSDDKPYMCDICGKGFKLRNCLRVHTQAHSEERPYYCQLCDGAFKSKKDLKKHQERHKSSKDHICGTCGKGFVTKNDVYLHQKVHDPSKDHRLYKPGKYKVSGGELLTARTRKNKLSLKEQEPISFDTEINGTGSLKLRKISKEKESYTSSERVLTGVSKSVCPSLGNKALSSESLSLETFLDTSDDSNEFHGFSALENASDAKSVDKCLSNSSDSTKDYSVGRSGHELETHERWSSVEMLEDYDWLDASSPQDDAVVESLAPVKDPLPSEHVHGSQIGGRHTPVYGDVTLLHCDDSQSIDSIQSLSSSLREFPDFEHEATEKLVDVKEGEEDVTLCESDVDLQSLNEYLNEELDNSQSLTQVNMDAFNRSLHSGEKKSPQSDQSQSSLEDSCEGDDSTVKKEGSGLGNVSYTETAKFDSISTPDNGETAKFDSISTPDNGETAKFDIISTPDNGETAKFDSISTPDIGEINFCGEAVMELSRNDQVFLKSDDNGLSTASSQLEVKTRERQLLIDFQMTSCDMFNDTSDIFEDNNSLDAKHSVDITHKYENKKNSVSFLRNETSSDSSYLTEVDDNLTEVDDNLTEVDDNLTEVDDNLTEVDDYLTEVDDNLTEVDDNLTEVDDNLTEVDDNLTEVDDNLTKVETEDNLSEVEIEDQHVEVEHYRMITNSVKHRERYKLVELVSEPEEFAHGIVRARKQRKQAASCWKCLACATTLSSRNGWNRHQLSCKMRSAHVTKMFKCGDCNRSYTTQSNLNTHWTACHAGGNQTFVCHLCGHACNDKQNLGNHLVGHSSARPFKCDLCQKCFKTQAAVRAHLNKHLPFKMLFQCELCHQFYNHFNSLRVHKQTHLSAVPLFTCNICGRKLSDRSNLTAHTKRHLVPRKYQCTVCSKELSSAHSLQGHQGRACLKHQLKTLKTREKTERSLIRKKAKEEREISKMIKYDI